ncbi:MAG: hypothetical protein Fues2KO_24020 [Fuerstiella sp.]
MLSGTAPTNILLSGSSAVEDLPPGQVIGAFSSADADASDTHTYSLVTGTGNEGNTRFTINGSELRTAQRLNYLQQSNHSIRVRTTDSSGLFFEKTFTITVTPVIGSPQLYQSILPPGSIGSPTGSRFGASVAASTSITVIGAPGVDVAGNPDVGQAFVFDTNSGSLIRTFNSPSTNAVAQLGYSTAVTGQLAIAGAPFDRVSGVFGAGRVFLQDANSGFITIIANPTPADTDTFGHAVAADGNFIAVSAPRDDTGATNSGAVYIYNTAGVLQRTILNPTPFLGDLFGFSLSMSGDLLAVGGAGEVSLFQASTGTRLRTITNPTFLNGDLFGNSVSLSGNRLAVGAVGRSFGSGAVGAVYVFDAGSGALLRTVSAPSPVVGEEFGSSVSLHGNLLAVGVPKGDVSGVTDVGTGYLYNIDTGALLGGMSNPFPSTSDQFGAAVAVFQTRVFVGAPLDDSPSFDQGHLHIFSASAPPFTVELSQTTVAENSAVGTVVGNLATDYVVAGTTYALVSGAGSTDNGKFTISGSQLRTNAAIDFEGQHTFSILVRATDSSGRRSERVFTIHATNVNETPIDLTLSAGKIAELSPIGSVVGSFTTVDPDTGDSFTYSLPNGRFDNAAFSIVGNQLRTNTDLDFETKDRYRIEVVSTDSGGLTKTAQFDIQVTDLNPPAGGAASFNLKNLVDLNATVQHSNPTNAVQLGGVTYVTASSPLYGTEVYRIDPVTGRATVLENLAFDTIGDANPHSLSVINGQLYFLSLYSYVDPSAPDGGGTPETRYGLFKSDGTQAGTVLISELAGVLPESMMAAGRPMHQVNGRTLFFAGDPMTGEQLWATDGTAAGTVLLHSFDMAMSPEPDQFLVHGNVLYINRNITAMSGTHELWRTDGTVAGTFLLRRADMSGGPSFASTDPRLVAVGASVFFASTTMEEGTELWKTDGTVSGTSLVADIQPGSFSGQPRGMTNVNGTLMFSADDGSVGRELWRSDGTSVGTTLVSDIASGPASGIRDSSEPGSFVAWNNQFYFGADDGNHGHELWRSDGTAAGTQIVADIGSGPNGLSPAFLTALSYRLLIQTDMFGAFGSQLWTSDGTTAGTQYLADPDGVSGHIQGSMVAAAGKTWFIANDGSTGSELWVTDGLAAGTYRVRDLNPGSGDGITSIIGIHSQGVYARGTDGIKGDELVVSDGTAAGTFVADIAEGTPAVGIRGSVAFGRDLLVATQQGLYRVDPVTSNSVRLTTHAASQLTVSGSRAFFVANASTFSFDQELWVTDGTITGTVLVKDIRPGTTSSEPKLLTAFDGGIFFVANDGTRGSELWVSYGNEFNTVLYHEFVAGAASGAIDQLMVVGDQLFVVANDTLFVKSGSTFVSRGPALRASLMPWNGVLYYAGHTAATGYELWRTDGTTSGTWMVADINPGPASSFPGGGVSSSSEESGSGGANLESRLIFRATQANGSSQLYVTDGTSGGTVALTNEPLVDISGNTYSLSPVDLTAVGGKVFFEGFRQDIGRELWVTDGTTTGTRPVADLRSGPAPDPSSGSVVFNAFRNLKNMTAFRDRLFFSTYDAAGDVELWTSDGTAGGTGRAVDILPGTQSGNPQWFRVFNDRLYMAADTVEFGVSQNSMYPGELFQLNEAPRSYQVAGVTSVGQPLSLTLRGSDADGDAVTYQITSPPVSGSVVVNGRTAVYTPASGFTGDVEFQYRVFDGSAYSENSTARIRVVAGAAPTVSFLSGTGTIDPAQGQGTYRTHVQLSAPAPTNLLIPFEYGFSTGETASLDVLFVSAGESQTELIVPVSIDRLYSAAGRPLELTLLPSMAANAGSVSQQAVSLAPQTVTPVISFAVPQEVVSETAGTIRFDVVLSAPSSQVVTATVSIHGSTATRGLDFTGPIEQQIVFSPGQTRQSVLLNVINDTLPENREAISAQLSSPVNGTVTSSPDGFRSIAWITDDDISTITLVPPPALIAEGESVVLTANRTGGNLQAPLTVPLSQVSGNSTTADYQLSGNAFQFAAGATEATVTLSITDDSVAELTEYLSLALTPPSGTQYLIGNQDLAYFLVYDNDTAKLSFTVLPYPPHYWTTERQTVSLRENHLPGQNHSLTVVARLSTPSSETVTVPAKLSPGSTAGYATRGTDYLFDDSPFVFAPGQTEVTRTLTIMSDFDIEPDELLRISLQPTEQQRFMTPNGRLDDDSLTLNVTIRNDDFRLTLDAPSRVPEDASSFTFTLDLGTEANSTQFVDLQFGGTLGVNEFQVGTLDDRKKNVVRFEPGERKKTFTVSLNADVPKTKSFTISASHRGSGFTQEITICNTDQPPSVKFRPPGFGLTLAPGGKDRLELELSAPAPHRLQIPFRLGGSAKRDQDYSLTGTAQSGVVTINTGETTGYIDIIPLDNNVPDGDKVVEVTIVGTLDIDVGNDPPKTSRIIREPQRPPTAVPKQPSYQPYQVALNTLPDATSLDALGTITGAQTASSSTGAVPVGQVAVVGTQKGIISGGTVFFDGNLNGIADFLDLNGNGRQDVGEPAEPTAVTAIDGSFLMSIPAAFDRNGDDRITFEEGRWVSVGGIDSSVELPMLLSLRAPAGIYTLTPYSTLLDSVLRQNSITLDDAIVRLSTSLGLSSYDPRSGTSIFNVLAGDATAAALYKEQVRLGSAALLSASLFAAHGSSSVQTQADLFFNLMAEKTAGLLQLEDEAIVRSLLNGMNAFQTDPVSADILDGTAQLIALSMTAVTDIQLATFSDPADFLESVTRLKKLLVGEISRDLQDVGNATQAISAVVNKYAGAKSPTLADRAATQTIGQVIPPVLGISDVLLKEDVAGASSMEFTVQLVGRHLLPVSVRYATADGTATLADGDYTSVNGQLHWAAGDNSPRTIVVPISADSKFEHDEYFQVVLTEAENAAIRIQNGYGYLLNDDTLHVGPGSTVTAGDGPITLSHSSDTIVVRRGGLIETSGLQNSNLNSVVLGANERDDQLTVDYSAGHYSADQIAFAGGTGNDHLQIDAGHFSSITATFHSGWSGLLSLNSETGITSQVSWTDLEQLLANVSTVGEFHIQLPAGITDVVVDDPDPAKDGQMRVRSRTDQFAPVVFTVPDAKIVVTLEDANGSVAVDSADPTFTGIIEGPTYDVVLTGGTIAENQPAGTAVGSLSQTNPSFVGPVTYSLVSGSGSTHNDAFYVDGTALKSTGSFDFETQSTYQVRIRATDTNGNHVESPLEVLVQNVTELIGIDVQLGQNQRSYVRYVDLVFDRSDDLLSLLDGSRFQLNRFDLNGRNGAAMTMPTRSVVGNSVRLDFGQQGIGGNRNSNIGDGYYQLLFDADDDGGFEEGSPVMSFHRLLGDVNGDGQVDSRDKQQVLSANGTNDAESDANGDGIVNRTDVSLTSRAANRKLRPDLFRND